VEEESDLIIVHASSPVLPLEVSEVVIVVSGTAETVKWGYETVKHTVQALPEKSIGMLVNMCNSEKEARAVLRRITQAAARFLNLTVSDLGHVLLETEIIKAVKARVPFLVKYPYCQASGRVLGIVRILADQGACAERSAGVEAFTP
jgi:flagellar biosynthesis protein FlhG